MARTTANKAKEKVEVVEESKEETNIVEENDAEKSEQTITVKKPKTKKKKQFDDEDRIACMCVFPGTVGMTGKRSRIPYYWEGMGTIEYVEYQDLRSEVLNKKSTYIYEPLILVLDEDFISQQPDLKRVYDSYYTPEQIVNKIKTLTPTQLRQFIKDLPVGIKENIKTIAVDMIRDGTLDSIKKIRVIDEIFGTDLNLYSTYFD